MSKSFNQTGKRPANYPAWWSDGNTIMDIDLTGGTDFLIDSVAGKGFVFDKSKNKVLGSNIATVTPTTGIGWTNDGGGQYTHSGGTASNLTFASILTTNRLYRVDYEIVSDNATGTMFISGPSATYTMSKVVGNRTMYFVCDNATLSFTIRHNTNASGSTVIRNITVREMQGNHLYCLAATKVPQYNRNAIAFDGGSDTMLSLSATAATTYIVAKKPGDNGFSVFTNIANIGELTSNVLTIGSNSAASSFYGVAIRRIIRRNSASTEQAVLDYLNIRYPAVAASRINLPSKMWAVVGFNVKLFTDSCVFGTDNGNSSPTEYNITITSDVGSQSGREWSYTPVSGEIGMHYVTVNVYDASTSAFVESKVIELNVIAATGLSTAKTVLMVGDSITNLNAGSGIITTTVRNNFVTLGGTTPTFVGPFGTAPNKHYGRAGWSFYDFAVNSTSSFVSGGVINIAALKSSLGVSNFDLVTFQLGPNTSNTTEMNEWTRYQELIYAKQLVNALLVDNPAVKIVILLSTSDSSINGELIDPVNDATYRRNVWRLREMLTSEFDNAGYNNNVYVAIAGQGLDRFTGYTAGDAIHPNNSGCGQAGNVIFPTILNILS